MSQRTRTRFTARQRDVDVRLSADYNAGTQRGVLSIVKAGVETVVAYFTDTQWLPQLATVLAGALTVTGITTFSTMFRIPRATLAAAGSTVTDAAQLVAGFTSVTAADGTKGVKLPATPVAGTICIVKSVTGGSVLKVWPDAAATINAIGSNGAISMASLTSAIFIADSTTQWYTLPLLPS